MTVSRSSTLAVAFSCIGHLFIHLCTAFYFVIVLALETEWQAPYHDLIQLWTLGSLLVGVAALPAGLLSDRLGPGVMMVVFFLGMGGASIAAGLTSAPAPLAAALAGVGLFASIYHPVGIPWLVRATGANRGTALGVNGVFGSMGSALAAVVAGGLIDLWGWRAAFIVPGVLCAVTGSALLVCLLAGLAASGKTERRTAVTERPSDTRRVFGILLVTMFIAGLVFHSVQTSLPKLFEQRHGGLVGEGTLGVGVLVAVVYAIAGIMQVAGGRLADRFPLKWVYLGSVLLQAPALWFASTLSGLPLVLTATLMVMAGASALPAENMLLARHTSEKHHGLVFGLKFVLSFGAAPLAVELVALVNERTGELGGLYVLLAMIALVAFTFALFLPGDKAAILTEPSAVPNME